MFLKSIHLNNVKCFSDIALSFEDENDDIRFRMPHPAPNQKKIMKNQDGNTGSPKLTEQIIREFGIDPAEIPSWGKLSLGQLYALLSRHPSLTELYEAGANAERNRRMDVLDDLRAMWHYEEDGGTPTPDELKHYGEAAWAAVDEIIRDADAEGRDLLAFYAQVEKLHTRYPNRCRTVDTRQYPPRDRTFTDTTPTRLGGL